jgi:hypothetical protein
MTTLLISATTIALGALTHPLYAQSDPVLATGARVRIVIPATATQDARRIQGDMLRLSGDSITLSRGVGSDARISTHLLGGPAGDQLEQLVVNRSYRWIGVLLGAAAGAFAGARLIESVDCNDYACGRQVTVEMFSTLIGGVIGGKIATSRRWLPVSITGVQIVIAPRGIGVGVPF